MAPTRIPGFVSRLLYFFDYSVQDNGEKQKIKSDAGDPCDLTDNIENHIVDAGATDDGEGHDGAFEDKILHESTMMITMGTETKTTGS
ncbi:hypothetical protein C4D60_Mb04t12500 [Musa balbisiana]|uniref:Uncharacterized protein n=1 Tax=Musa balbisiana TaxID=52838 RepID=A0A4S8KBK2_MUSBA|nr:hypothetical protein C4D60_Mb04t12500 [Musa balbisiana]